LNEAAFKFKETAVFVRSPWIAMMLHKASGEA
jgi:hypothetical protein